MHARVQVVTTPTADTPGTLLLLHFDNKRYLIGALAEGTQRAAIERGVRLLKVSEIFVAGRCDWAHLGGMVGAILTLADVTASSLAAQKDEAEKKARRKREREGNGDGSGKTTEVVGGSRAGGDGGDVGNKLTIFGPRNLNHTLATARRFVFRKGMPLDVHEIREELGKRSENGQEESSPYWSDDNMGVWALCVSPSVSPSARVVGSPPQSISPRKRSFEEVDGSEDKASAPSSTTAAKDATALTDQEKDYLTVKAVVTEMFGSSWRLDTLHETRLGDVKLPASIFVRDPTTKKIERYSGPLPGKAQPEPDPDQIVLVRKPWPGALVETLPPTEPAKEAVSYIFRIHDGRGKFDTAAATRLKVPKGVLWTKLAKGENVLNEDSETITPDMVLGSARKGGGLVVASLPDPEYIDNFLARPEWSRADIMGDLGSFVWLCGADVARDPRIHAFMQKMGSMQHIVSSPDYCPNHIAMTASAASTVRLQQLDPDRYRVPVHDADIAVKDYGGSSSYLRHREAHPLPTGAEIATPGQSFTVMPFKFTNDTLLTPLDIDAAAASVPAAAVEHAQEARKAITKPDESLDKWIKTLPPGAAEAEIVTLGTGSALPSKYRNVSSTLVMVPGWGNILFDAGENTLGQLKRVFSESELQKVMQDLRLISISHMHADHHLGLISVVKDWYKRVHQCIPASASNSNPKDFADLLDHPTTLSIVAEPTMHQFLHEYSSVEDFGYSRVLPVVLSITAFNSRLQLFTPPATLSALSPPAREAHLAKRTLTPASLGLRDLRGVPVQHCLGARAVAVTLPSGFKVSFSGDCRPSAAFARGIGRGSTVCIHEATFDDELQGDALAKKHSTTSEALAVAQAMRARACVLTHFSQRYQKLPVLERSAEAREEGEDAAVPVPADDGLMHDGEGDENDGDAGDGGMDVFAEGDPPRHVDTHATERYQPIAVDGVRSSSGPNSAVKFALASDMRVCVAFDYMRVKVKDIGHLEKFTPALLKLFAEEEQQVEGKS